MFETRIVNETSVTLVGLLAYSTYEIIITGENEAGLSNIMPIYYSTPEAGTAIDKSLFALKC